MSFQPTIAHASKDVATAGTAVALVATDTFVYSVLIQAKKANTGEVFLGNSSVSSSSFGTSLAAGEVVSYQPPNSSHGHTPIINLADFYIDCEGGNTDGVTILYVTADYNQHSF